jgi:hypothetical protein
MKTDRSAWFFMVSKIDPAGTFGFAWYLLMSIPNAVS